MKKLVGLIVCIFLFGNSRAQLIDGSIAPDFTFTDIAGNTQHLYSYLDSGKYVAIDISATWCHPCWLYHNTLTMDSLYNLHDMPGDKTWKVLFIEGDGGTSNADLNGTGTSTQGDWVTGTLFPIIDPPTGIGLNDFSTGYNVSYFPTLYLICPNRRVIQDTLNAAYKPTVSVWEHIASNAMCSSPLSLTEKNDETNVTVFPNPAYGNVSLYFNIENSTSVQLKVTSILGQTVESKYFGQLAPGKQTLEYDINEYAAGLYFFALSFDNKTTVHQKVLVR